MLSRNLTGGRYEYPSKGFDTSMPNIVRQDYGMQTLYNPKNTSLIGVSRKNLISDSLQLSYDTLGAKKLYEFS